MIIMLRAAVRRQLAEKEPYRVWNAFIGLIAYDEHYDEFTPLQRAAHLAFTYDSEIQNGGHFQYFENWGLRRIDETLDALSLIGAAFQREVLSAAVGIYHVTNQANRKVHTVEEFCARALEGDYDECDSKYYDCQPEVVKLLEACLQANRDEFVELV